MPAIHLIPVTDGMPKDEVMGRIQMGWVLAGRQAVNLKAQGIVTAGEAMTPTGMIDMDVWVLPEPMMPQGQVVKMLYDLFTQKMGDVSTLNTIAVALLGLDIEALVERMDASIYAANQAQNTEGMPCSGPKQDDPVEPNGS